MRPIKKLASALLKLLAAALFVILICNYIVNKKAAAYLYENIEDAPKHKVGLLLGTSKYVRGGRLNLFFYRRLDAAVLLFKEKKIDYIIASGDNRTASYNEPQSMKEELVRRGIPEKKIYLDFAGLRTLDSVVRCQKVFGQDSFIIISQKFHNERAVFIARTLGIKASAFNARSVSILHAPKTALREYFAKVKAFIDVYTGVDPKYLGEKIMIK
jgi:SanA protein